MEWALRCGDIQYAITDREDGRMTAHTERVNPMPDNSLPRNGNSCVIGRRSHVC
ncbi:MAG: hypothetical protein JWL77_7161 [Chthonomonadaceae bacterium]|nr:hypothetical protein [Chthonomonadaceae bacterium]